MSLIPTDTYSHLRPCRFNLRVLILGGSRFFGRLVAEEFLRQGADVTVLNRQGTPNITGAKSIVCDRNNPNELECATSNHFWDIIFDNICMNGSQAEHARRLLMPRTGRYIMTSSQSVYPMGANLKEEDFEPSSYELGPQYDFEDYCLAKRQAEAVVSRDPNFKNLLILRPSIVLGKEDHTGRLNFHINHIKEQKPIFFPTLNADLSICMASDLAKSITKLAVSDVSGPINLASATPIKISELVRIMEDTLKVSALLVSEPRLGVHSPYGVESDWYMSTEKAIRHGLQFMPVQKWLPEVIHMATNHNNLEIQECV